MPTKKVTTSSSSTTKKTTASKKTTPAKKPTATASATPPAAEPMTEKSNATAAADTAGEKSTAKSTAKAAMAKKSTDRPKAAGASVTKIIAKVDLGYGNNLYLRGEGAELSWTKGILMENTATDEWSWTSQGATGPLTFKFLINDEIWSAGDNHIVAPGDTSVSTPVF